MQFEYDFRTWRHSRQSQRIDEFLRQAVGYLSVEEPSKQELVQQEIGLGFSEGHLEGYFEVIWSSESGTIFID